jgi:ABC-type nitrate/sulfonate/bicarbonate transport system ATPase subunit
MQTKIEAPGTEPLSIDETGVALTAVARRYRARAGGPRTGRRARGQHGELVALEGLDLEVRGREVLAVVGPSGCGKSTLLELVAGLQEPDEGAVVTAGASRAEARRSKCAYMPQRDLLLPWRDALANAALALECQGVPRAEARRRAAPLFERFGLGEFERSLPADLSGGMRQRVAFLRTLLAGRPVLALDEPFGALDSITRGTMQQWLADALAAEPRTVILVTHDVEEALFLADRVAVLSPRPGTVVAELAVRLERPRSRRATVTDPGFAGLKERALEALDAGGEPRGARREAAEVTW